MKLSLPQIAHVVLGWLLGLGMFPLAAHAASPTPTSTTLTAVQLRVLLRTSGGQPVPGIAVDLVPVAPELGSLPVDTPTQSGQTDATGAVLFDVLQGAIWRVTFTGRYAGQPIQPVAAQGQAPYGTTHGAGFVVQTSLHEENDAPAPVIELPAPPIELLSFVLLSRTGEWIPAIDLAPPSDQPQPLNGLAQSSTQPMFYGPAPQLRGGELPLSEPFPQAGRTNTPDGGFLGLWLLPAIAAGVALWRVWRSRGKGEHSKLAGRDGTYAEQRRGNE